MNNDTVNVQFCTMQAWPIYAMPVPERVKPGITLRDIRLAILIETMFTESYEADGHGASVYIGKTQPLEPRAIGESVMAGIRNYHSKSKRPKKPFRTRHCTICEQNSHHMVNCPERFSKEVKSACGFCGGMHWRINCPLLRPPPPVLAVPDALDFDTQTWNKKFTRTLLK